MYIVRKHVVGKPIANKTGAVIIAGPNFTARRLKSSIGLKRDVHRLFARASVTSTHVKMASPKDIVPSDGGANIKLAVRNAASYSIYVHRVFTPTRRIFAPSLACTSFDSRTQSAVYGQRGNTRSNSTPCVKYVDWTNHKSWSPITKTVTARTTDKKTCWWSAQIATCEFTRV